RAQIVNAVVYTTKGTRRETAVTARFFFWSAFKDQHGYAVLGGCVSSAKGCVSGTDNHDVTGGREHEFLSVLLRQRLAAFSDPASRDSCKRGPAGGFSGNNLKPAAYFRQIQPRHPAKPANRPNQRVLSNVKSRGSAQPETFPSMTDVL